MPPAVAEPPVAPPAAEPEQKPEDKKPVLDRNRPLSQQVDKILANMPPDPDKEGDEGVKPPADQPKDKPAGTEKEGEGQVSAESGVSAEGTAAPGAEEDEESDSYVEPVELPPWQKYVIDKLPEISVVGHVEGKADKVFTIKRAEDLPDTFEFASKRSELMFNAAIASQEVNARELLNKYNQEQAQAQYQKLKAQEAIDVQSDIKALQREGVLPNFQYNHTDTKFNDDPAVKEANEIYDLFEKTNNAYIQAGKTYRISYRDAADKFYAARGRQKPAATPKAEKTPNTQEREKVATQVGSGQGVDPGTVRKTMPPGSNMQDILQAYKLGRI